MMFLKYFILLYLFKNVFMNMSESDIGINVGTVLFTPYDTQKKCWTNEQLALLHSRYVFQDILPNCEPNNLQNDKTVAVLVNYFRMALNKVKTMTTGKTKQIHLLALTDTIGGYLHHIFLPTIKQGFYMGCVNLASAESVQTLYDEITTFLRTDGKSWSPPISPPGKVKRSKRAVSFANEEPTEGACKDLVVTTYRNHDVSIPMPFLDSKENPSSIAIPFRKQPLRKLRSRDSENMLSKFYEDATKCMSEQQANKASVAKFNKEFSKFLESEIIPHTKDEELLPALGGIYVLAETVKNGGHAPEKPPGAGENKTSSEEKGIALPGDENNESYETDEDKTETIMFIAVAVVICIWIITGLIYCCCRARRKDKDEAKSRSSLSEKSGSEPKKVGFGARRNKKDIAQKDRSGSCSKESLVPTPPPEKKESKEKVKVVKKVESKPPEPKDKKPAKPPAKQPPAKQPPPKKEKVVRQKSGSDVSAPCPKCGMKKCQKHKNVQLMPMPSTTTAFALSSPELKGVRSSPLSIKPGEPTISEKFRTSSSTSTDKPIVFGYDFETSSSDSSSYDDDTSSYGGYA